MSWFLSAVWLISFPGDIIFWVSRGWPEPFSSTASVHRSLYCKEAKWRNMERWPPACEANTYMVYQSNGCKTIITWRLYRTSATLLSSWYWRRFFLNQFKEDLGGSTRGMMSHIAFCCFPTEYWSWMTLKMSDLTTSWCQKSLLAKAAVWFKQQWGMRSCLVLH